MIRFAVGLVLAVSCSLVYAAAGGIVDSVKAAVGQRQFGQAESMISAYKSKLGITPELVEAQSWLARGAAMTKRWADAERYAKTTEDLITAQLARQSGNLDREAHLPLALGAVIEVKAQNLVAQGQRDQAVAFLDSQLRKYYATSIRTRIQKNINQMTLEGKPLPPLVMTEFVGARPAAPLVLRGRPVLLFFWAHWCSDCKAEVAILAKLKAEYAARGVLFLAPTQRYGYVAGGEDAPPAVERQYIKAVRAKFYTGLLDLPAPLSEENFKRFGCSTTPTLVLADRNGIVRMYHPGAMTEAGLRTQLETVAKL